jgi:hypothetical protein
VRQTFRAAQQQDILLASAQSENEKGEWPAGCEQTCFNNHDTRTRHTLTWYSWQTTIVFTDSRIPSELWGKVSICNQLQLPIATEFSIGTYLKKGEFLEDSFSKSVGS